MTNRMRRHATRWFGLGLFVLILSAAGLLLPGPAGAASVSVVVENYDFAPSSRTITAGDVVRWTFSGDQHSVTSRDGLFDSGIRNPGATFQFTFAKAGTYRYYCVVHPDLMSGTIVVKARSATPAPTVRPTPKPTARATTQPTARPTPTPRPTPTDAGTSGSPAPSASPSPAASPAASLALLETPGSTTLPASPPAAPTEPTSAIDATPILAALALLAVVVVGAGLLVARRRRST